MYVAAASSHPRSQLDLVLLGPAANTMPVIDTNPTQADAGRTPHVDVTIDQIDGASCVVDVSYAPVIHADLESAVRARSVDGLQGGVNGAFGRESLWHDWACVVAVEDALGVQLPNNVRVVRNLLYGAALVKSHLVGFYSRALADFVRDDGRAPWVVGSTSDCRLAPDVTVSLLKHAAVAADAAQTLDEIIRTAGEASPGQSNNVPGGLVRLLRSDQVSKIRSALDAIQPFIVDALAEDTACLGLAYPECAEHGGSGSSFLSVGAFAMDNEGKDSLFRRGRVAAGGAVASPVDKTLFDWRTPGAVLCGGSLHETGPLARMAVNSDHASRSSALDRHIARATEARLAIRAMQTWLGQIEMSGPTMRGYMEPERAVGIGLVETPNGSLAHCVRLERGRVLAYRVASPDQWHAGCQTPSPQKGLVECALLGTPVRRPADPVEVRRVLRSIDPDITWDITVGRPNGCERVYAVASTGPIAEAAITTPLGTARTPGR